MLQIGGTQPPTDTQPERMSTATGSCPDGQSAGARRGHFDTKDTKITKGTKKSCGAFAAETAGSQPRDDRQTSFALFASFVSKCPRPTPGFRASPQNQGRRAPGFGLGPPHRRNAARAQTRKQFVRRLLPRASPPAQALSRRHGMVLHHNYDTAGRAGAPQSSNVVFFGPVAGWSSHPRLVRVAQSAETRAASPVKREAKGGTPAHNTVGSLHARLPR